MRIMAYTRKIILAILGAGSALFIFAEAYAQNGQTKVYSVITHTSDIKKAATGANVFITLYGTTAPNGIGPFLLNNRNEDDFERDKLSLFQIRSMTDIGEVTNIKLEHDDSGLGAGWHLGNVAIIEPAIHDPEDYKKRFKRDVDKDEFTILKGDVYIDPSVTVHGMSFYNFNTWIASDEDPNKGRDKPTLSRRRVDYHKFIKAHRKKIKATSVEMTAKEKVATKFRHTKNAALPGLKRRTFSNLTVDQCQTACLNEDGFYCKSIDFDKVNRYCFLSMYDASGELNLEIEFANHPYDHYQRIAD